MKTDADMTAEVIWILDEGTPDGHTAHDVSGIVEACHREAGSWDLAMVSTERFWHIVQAIDAANRSHPRKADGVSGEQLLGALVAFYALQRGTGRNVTGSAVLIEAARLLHDESEDEANERVADMIEDYLAGRA